MAELYLFFDGTSYYPFTPNTVPEVYETRTYQPTIITRTQVQLTEQSSKTSVSFKFERSHSFARNLLVNLSEIPVLVTIYKSGLIYWQGQVIGVKGSKGEIEIACDSNFSKISRAGRQPRITLECRHVLYSLSCGVNKEAFKKLYPVNSLNSNILDISSIEEADGYYTGGIASINGQSRGILKHSGTVLTLDSSFMGYPSGQLALYPGCNLSESVCNTRFNNIINFGGFARTPTKNPFSSTGLL